jgi:hypothetical protein
MDLFDRALIIRTLFRVVTCGVCVVAVVGNCALTVIREICVVVACLSRHSCTTRIPVMAVHRSGVTLVATNAFSVLQ